MGEKIFVIGHLQPDTDSVLSAIAYANLKNSLNDGNEYVPAISGETNLETNFILEKFGIEKPVIVENEGDSNFILVDHNEEGQSVVKDANKILEIIDHHKLGGLATKNPLFLRFEPVGCTATIIKKMYEENDVGITPGIAKMLISANISDTLFGKSSTTTDDDKKALIELNEIAKIDDLEKFVFNIFDAKSVIANESADKIFNNDCKEFDFNDKKVMISQVETVNVEKIISKKNELLNVMNNNIENGFYANFLMVTDILNEITHLLVVSNDETLLETMKVKDNLVLMPNVMSRKKDFLPKMFDIIK